MIDPAWFWLLLSSSTMVIVVLAVAMCRKSRSIAPAIGSFFLYFWSLHGGWFIVEDLSGGNSGMSYHYLFDKIFPIHLDTSYLCALSLYAIFAIIVQIAFLCSCKPVPKSSVIALAVVPTPLIVDHRRMLALAASCGAISVAIMYGPLMEAARQGISAYILTRSGDAPTPLFALHQELNRFSLTPAAFGVAIIASGRDARYLVSAAAYRRTCLAGYAALLAAMLVFCMLLGNKNEAFVAMIAAVLFYIANARSPLYWPLIGIASVGLACISVVDYVRGLSLSTVSASDVAGNTVKSFAAIGTSNEAYGSHFSMYGALAFDVPLTWGSSLISLACSVVPRALWQSRPDDVYVYYAASVRADPSQGYTIHHATGWYLNFGLPGIIVGAWLLGFVWGRLASRVTTVSSSSLPSLMRIVGASTLVAALPTVIRAGPEVYKGLILEAFLIPAMALRFAIHRRGPEIMRLKLTDQALARLVRALTSEKFTKPRTQRSSLVARRPVPPSQV